MTHNLSYVDKIKILAQKNITMHNGDVSLGNSFSLGQLQVLFGYVLDGTMSVADMQDYIDSKIE
jgi:uncharacterized protein YpmS